MNAPENSERPYRRYVVGEVIELRLTITHQQNLESVWAVYGREGREENTITFQGEIDETTQIESDPEGDKPLPRKRSVAVLRMVVDVDHRPGHYQLLEAGFRSVSGFEMHMRAYDPQAPTGENLGLTLSRNLTRLPGPILNLRTTQKNTKRNNELQRGCCHMDVVLHDRHRRDRSPQEVALLR